MRACKPPIFCVLLFLVAAAVRSNAKCAFPAIFNFGDSNSDTGGFWAAFPAQHDPFGVTYFKKPSGRATDGRLVIDFLANALGLPFLSPYLQSIGSNYSHGANFATLASTVMLPNTSLFVSGISPFSLAIQLNQMKELKARTIEQTQQVTGEADINMNLSSRFSESRVLFRRLGTGRRRRFPPTQPAVPAPAGQLPPENVFQRSLYIFDIGQNDFTSNLATVGIDQVKMSLPQVIDQIISTIRELYEIGGRTFMVFNLAPIGCYPSFLTELTHNHTDLDKYGCLASYNNAVDYYNGLLKGKLHEARDPLHDATIVYVDTHSVKLELYQHPKEHGLQYGTKACCGYGGGAYNFDRRVYCGNNIVISGKNMTAVACADPEKYVSWDGIHATEAANRIVTQAILNGSLFDPPFPLSKLCDLQSIG